MKYLILLLVLAGCTISEDVDSNQVSGPDISYCKDTRDGETFSFRKEDIHKSTIGFSDSCFDITDTDGRARTLCKSHELWLKCSPDPQS